MATLTNLGVMQKTASLIKSEYYKYGIGNMYHISIYFFGGAVQGTKPINILILNHDTGETIGDIVGPVGRPYSTFMHPDNGLYYIGNNGTADVPGNIASLNITTGEVIKLADFPTYAGTPAEVGVNVGTWSDEPNKRLLYGSATKAALFAWDPVTGTGQDYGIIDDQGSPYNTNMTSLQVDGSYAYCGLKDNDSGLMRLVAVNLSTEAQTVIWGGVPLQTQCYAYRGYDGNIYIQRIVNSVTTWYLVDAANEPVLQVGTPSCYSHNTRSTVNYTGYAFREYLAYPDGLGGLEVPLNYQRPGDTEDRVAYANLYQVEDFEVNRTGLGLGGEIICFGDSYSPITMYDPATETKSFVGVATSLSGYSVGQDRHKRTLCFGGYPRTMDWEWDPSLEWVSGVNPKKLTLADGGDESARYTYAILQGSDGRMWFAYSTTRTTVVESIIAAINLNDYSTIVISETVPVAGNPNLNAYSMENFARSRGGLHMLFSGQTATDSLLARIPVWGERVSMYMRPIAGGASQGRVVSVERSDETAGHFLGITTGANYQVYCVNILSGQLVWGPLTKTGTAVFVNGASPAFDGQYVYFYVSNNICRINPADGADEVVVAIPSSAGAHLTYSRRNHCLYHNDADKNLYEISL